MSVALTILASSATHSPTAALIACLVATLAWRAGALYGAAVATGAVLILARFDPSTFHHAPRANAVTALVLLMAASTGAGAALRYLEREREPAEPGGSRPDAATPRRASSGRAVLAADEIRDRAIELETMQRALAEIRRSLDADDASVWMIDAPDATLGSASPARLVAWSADDTGVPGVPFEPVIQWAAEEGLVTANQPDAPIALLAAPLRTGTVRGALVVRSHRRTPLEGAAARAALADAAAQLGRLGELLADGRETRRYRDKAELLARAAERVQTSQDVAGLGHAICEAAVELAGATRAAVVVTDDGTERCMVLSTSVGHPVPAGLEVTPESFAAAACLERQRFVAADAVPHAACPLFSTTEPPRTVGSFAAVPLVRDGQGIGALVVEGESAGQITDVEGSLLLLLSSVAAAAHSRVRHLEEVTARSRVDELTRLANRRVFDERLRQHLQECDRFDHALSLILLDIDHFKRINDELGHPAGDRVLRDVALAVARGTRNVDLTARYGGEEFAVLLPQTALDRSRTVAERLRHAVESLTVNVDGHWVSPTVSVGVAAYPACVRSGESLFSAADKALYQAKRDGRNCVRCAEPRVHIATA